MNEFLNRWVDLFAMVVSLGAAIYFTICFVRRSRGKFRPIFLFFLIFGPMVIAVHMAMHLFAISYLASQQLAAGTFTYDFRFYSLLMMALVLGVLSWQQMQSCLQYFVYRQNTRKDWLHTCAWIILAAAPTIPFTIIGSLPVLAVAINLFASFFVRKPIKILVPTIAQEPMHAFPAVEQPA